MRAIGSEPEEVVIGIGIGIGQAVLIGPAMMRHNGRRKEQVAVPRAGRSATKPYNTRDTGGAGRHAYPCCSS